jgi:hypothetical protein
VNLKTNYSIVGFIPKENLIVLHDGQNKFHAVRFPLALLEFEAAIAEGEQADFETIPEEFRTKAAKFLKQIGKKELALQVAIEPAIRFDLAKEL